ncbi:MAG: UbiA family prenyltransferase [Polyangiaceae bacterium]|nr:UbiA family prenyltransferase [Polyangiaceae bacterium]
MRALLAALRILRDVIIYRLRKREMANLAASASIMVAISLPWHSVAVRLVFGLVLNLFAYLTNDLYDVEADEVCADRDSTKAAHLRTHRSAAIATLLVLFALLLGIGLATSFGLAITALTCAGLCWAYSARLKCVPILDVATIAACGVAGSMLAFPLDRAAGWLLAMQLGLFAASFQTVQIVRDHDHDAVSGCRTTGVLLGETRTIVLQRGLLVMSALYATIALHTWIGTGMLGVACLRFPPKQASRHWNRIRLALGVAWLAIVTMVRVTGRTHGLLFSVDASVVLEPLSGVR